MGIPFFSPSQAGTYLTTYHHIHQYIPKARARDSKDVWGDVARGLPAKANYRIPPRRARALGDGFTINRRFALGHLPRVRRGSARAADAGPT